MEMSPAEVLALLNNVQVDSLIDWVQDTNEEFDCKIGFSKVEFIFPDDLCSLVVIETTRGAVTLTEEGGLQVDPNCV